MRYIDNTVANIFIQPGCLIPEKCITVCIEVVLKLSIGVKFKAGSVSLTRRKEYFGISRIKHTLYPTQKLGARGGFKTTSSLLQKVAPRPSP